MADRKEELLKLANVLTACITELFRMQGDVKFSSAPLVERKNIIEYGGRMRADGMQKFNNPTFVSTINYYATAKDMEKHNALGTIIVYVEQSFVVPILKMLKYPPMDDESEDDLKDCCGTLCNLIAGRFKTEIASMGYVEPEMSPFVSYKNSIFGGAEFCFKEFDKYELTFFINGEKRLVVEMTMGPIPRAK